MKKIILLGLSVILATYVGASEAPIEVPDYISAQEVDSYLTRKYFAIENGQKVGGIDLGDISLRELGQYNSAAFHNVFKESWTRFERFEFEQMDDISAQVFVITYFDFYEYKPFRDYVSRLELYEPCMRCLNEILKNDERFVLFSKLAVDDTADFSVLLTAGALFLSLKIQLVKKLRESGVTTKTPNGKTIFDFPLDQIKANRTLTEVCDIIDCSEGKLNECIALAVQAINRSKEKKPIKKVAPRTEKVIKIIPEYEKWDFIEQKFETELLKIYNEEDAHAASPLINIIFSLGIGALTGVVTARRTNDVNTGVAAGIFGTFFSGVLINLLLDKTIQYYVENRDFRVLSEFVEKWPEYQKYVPGKLHHVFERLYRLYQNGGKDALRKGLKMVQVVRNACFSHKEKAKRV